LISTLRRRLLRRAGLLLLTGLLLIGGTCVLTIAELAPSAIRGGRRRRRLGLILNRGLILSGRRQRRLILRKGNSAESERQKRIFHPDISHYFSHHTDSDAGLLPQVTSLILKE
jgi:hypothetical protein